MSGKFSGPLPGIPRPNVGQDVQGCWRGVVESLSPLRVSVPNLAGQGVALGHCEVVYEVVALVDLAEGDRVWVQCIEGVPTDLLITARRR